MFFNPTIDVTETILNNLARRSFNRSDTYSIGNKSVAVFERLP